MPNFAILLAAAVTALAPAAPVQPPHGIRIATHDLDLGTARGHRTLTLRIARAASRLCDSVDGRFDARIRVAQRLCRQEAIATALANAPVTVRLALRSTR